MKRWYSHGVLSIGRLTIWGRSNAMHFAINYRSRRWGAVCFHPPMYALGAWWPWYFYVSPNSTPWASTFAIGPGIDTSDKAAAPLRRFLHGHNYSTDRLERYANGVWM